MSATSVTVRPPLRSSVCAIAASERPFADPLCGQIRPVSVAPFWPVSPATELYGDGVDGGAP